MGSQNGKSIEDPRVTAQSYHRFPGLLGLAKPCLPLAASSFFGATSSRSLSSVTSSGPPASILFVISTSSALAISTTVARQLAYIMRSFIFDEDGHVYMKTIEVEDG